MALRGTLTHWKTRVLASELGIDPCFALGILEALWHTAAELAPAGDIGRLPNQAIAAQMYYTGDPEVLIAALLKSGHLEPHETHRLVIHDWKTHSEYNVRRKIARRGESSLIANGGHRRPMAANGGHGRPVAADGGPEPVVRLEKPAKKVLDPKFLDETHAEFYAAYWLHVSKQRSRNAWPGAVLKVSRLRSVSPDDAARYLAAKATEQRALVESRPDLEWLANTHPSSWLNGESWDNEIPPEKPQSNGKGKGNIFARTDL